MELWRESLRMNTRLFWFGQPEKIELWLSWWKIGTLVTDLQGFRCLQGILMEMTRMQLLPDFTLKWGLTWDKNLAVLSKCMHTLVAQSCPTLCDPMDCSLPDFSVHGITQARILEWVAMPFPDPWVANPGIEPCLLHCRLILYHLSYKEVPPQQICVLFNTVEGIVKG